MRANELARAHVSGTASRACRLSALERFRIVPWGPTPITIALLLHHGSPPSATTVAPPAWTIKDAEKLYNMKAGASAISGSTRKATSSCTPTPTGSVVSTSPARDDLEAQGVGLPLLLRFSDILRSRIEALATEFSNAIKEFGYEGSYTTVYPIKVNQQRHVVEEIVEFGAAHGVGLECGSKPELQAVLGLTSAPIT